MSERFDILNPDGTFTGTTQLRHEAHAQGLWHRTAHIWVLRADGAILLQRRSPSKESFPDTWDISCAGHIDAGETPLQGAVRELGEELGLAVSHTRLRHITTLREENPLHIGTGTDREFHEVFSLQLESGEESNIQWDPVELSAIRWFTPDELSHEVRTKPAEFAGHPDEYGLVIRGIATSTAMATPEFLQQLSRLRSGSRRLRDAWGAVPPLARHWRPAVGKWSPHEILLHVADAEMHFALRIRFAFSQPGTGIVPFDQDAWARELDYTHTEAELALGLFESLRDLTCGALERLPESARLRHFVHPEAGTVTIDTYLKKLDSHLESHIAQIQRTVAAWQAQGA